MRISLKKRKSMIAEELEGNTDLLIEILNLLPPKSIFKCRCVSKRWNGIIVDPLFRKTYSSTTRKQQGAGGRLLAFVQQRSYPYTFVNILSIAQQDEQRIKPIEPWPDSFGTAIHSLDGLFLCNDYRISCARERRYHVVNPLTKKWVQLPPHTTDHRLRGVGLACKENMKELVPSFRVIGIVDKFDYVKRTLDIETYSHDTGRWATSTLVANEGLVPSVVLTLVCKGVFHWCMYRNTMVIYNSNREENCVHSIKLPWCSYYNEYSATRSSADDLLWISSTCQMLGGLVHFWKLRIDDYYNYESATTILEDQWILVQRIDATYFDKEISFFLKNKKIKSEEITDGSNWHTKVEALIPSNPVAAVLNMRQKMFLYNIESQSLEFVRYHGRPRSETLIAGWLPFTESRSLSSYGPLGSTYM